MAKNHRETAGHQLEPGYLKSFVRLVNIWTVKQGAMLSSATRTIDWSRFLFVATSVPCPKACSVGLLRT